MRKLRHILFWAIALTVIGSALYMLYAVVMITTLGYPLDMVLAPIFVMCTALAVFYVLDELFHRDWGGW